MLGARGRRAHGQLVPVAAGSQQAHLEGVTTRPTLMRSNEPARRPGVRTPPRFCPNAAGRSTTPARPRTDGGAGGARLARATRSPWRARPSADHLVPGESVHTGSRTPGPALAGIRTSGSARIIARSAERRGLPAGSASRGAQPSRGTGRPPGYPSPSATVMARFLPSPTRPAIARAVEASEPGDEHGSEGLLD